ncbi:MAG TPA: HAD-IB family hydrolase [Candidatus Acidoferrum sp.]|nr:HAD-IB family hydrolase [Candidatus Acidoferrum sp.]
MKRLGTSGRVAAFFDLDGTLIARPSLERRLFAELRYRRVIPMRNYFLWLARAAWLAPRGIQMMRHANKMYLRGVCAGESGSRRGSGQPEMAVPRFFPEGVDQVAWHAQQGHAIVLVSGTLALLAQEIALALVVRLAVRGIAASVAVCATRLEENEGRWTGRIVGDAMFGEAKARAVRRLAVEKGFELAQCCAYGDRASDRWMLEAVGRAVAVNPSRRMERLARRRGWSMLKWAEGKDSTQISQRMERARRRAEEIWENVG